MSSGGSILGFVGALVSFWIPPLGIAMMIGGGMWSAYEQRKAMQAAQERAKANRGGIKGNTRTSQRPIPVVYGKTRAGGNIIYQHTGGIPEQSGMKNRDLHTIIGVSEGPIEAFEGVWLNDTKIWEAASGMINIQSGFLDTPYRYYFQTADSFGRIFNDLDFRLGCNSQAVFTQINSMVTNWGYDLDGNYVQKFDLDFSERYPMTAVGYSRLFYPVPDTDPLFQGFPTITFDVRGKRVRDLGSVNDYLWSDNPAYVLFDVLTNKQYGWSIPSSKIDLSSFQSVGSFCAGSGSGAFSITQPVGTAPVPYSHLGVGSAIQPGATYATFNPDNYSALQGVQPSAVYEPTSFLCAPFATGSVVLTVTQSIYYDQSEGILWDYSFAYGLYADASGYLRFTDYKMLNYWGGVTLNAGPDYMPFTPMYPGGEISSGTIVGSIDFATGSLSWQMNSIHGMFHPVSSLWTHFNQPAYIEATWLQGYGGTFYPTYGNVQGGSITITATMADNTTEVLTETASGSGIFLSTSLSGGRSTGGGAVDYNSGAVFYYYTANPAVNPSIDYDRWINMGYSFNGILLDASPAVDVVRDICQHFRGYLTYKQGIYHLNVDQTGSAVYAFDEDSIKVGTFVINQTPISERPNRIRVKYTDRQENYTQMDVIYEPPNPIISTEEVVIEHTINLEKCVYKDQAYRMAQTLGRQAQLGNAIEFVTGQEGLNVDIGDLVTVTWPPAAWVDKIFRVSAMEERAEEEVHLSCVEYDASVYADEYTG